MSREKIIINSIPLLVDGKTARCRSKCGFLRVDFPARLVYARFTVTVTRNASSRNAGLICMGTTRVAQDVYGEKIII